MNSHPSSLTGNGGALRATAGVQPWVVRCPWSILKEIHGVVLGGVRKLSRGGVEVGGLLYGRRSGCTIRILAWRSMQCEHSVGPAFLLSAADHAELRRQMGAAGGDPKLAPLQVVGWFVSHTRAGLRMTSADVALFQRYFPQPWQVTLVYSPVAHEETKTGFFVRDANGVVHAEKCGREFTIAAGRSPAGRQGQTVAVGVPTHTGIPEQRAGALPSTMPLGGRARAGALIVLLCGLALCAVPLTRNLRLARQPLQLRFSDTGNAVHIQWNGTSSALANAQRARLTIEEVGSSLTIELDRTSLGAGTATYAGWGHPVRVDMKVERSGPSGSWEAIGSRVPRRQGR